MSKKRLAWSVIPFCLCLVMLGIRLPDLSRLHSPPKPRPRAVVETTSKIIQPASANQVLFIELCDNVPALLPPNFFRTSLSRETCRFSSTTPPQFGARAPPFLDC